MLTFTRPVNTIPVAIKKHPLKPGHTRIPLHDRLLPVQVGWPDADNLERMIKI